jgi:UDP-N-acetylglucosamine--N-acetylmuramyl-(pentapeptide) pyrophosphoryl-undecaprenol N-acetylglucosamine transferase
MGVLVVMPVFVDDAAHHAHWPPSDCAGPVCSGLVAQGVAMWVGFQAFINIGVNLGALPTKGLTLPLMSFGGSAILMNHGGAGGGAFASTTKTNVLMRAGDSTSYDAQPRGLGMSANVAKLIMAGGTGGHIFPGLAVAEALRARGWRVHWLGAPASMEARMVPRTGLRWRRLIFWPARQGRDDAAALAAAAGAGVLAGARRYCGGSSPMWSSAGRLHQLSRRHDGAAGGQAAGAARAKLGRRLANKVLARLADRVFTAFPECFSGMFFRGWVGNPLRAAFHPAAPAVERFAGRSGPLRAGGRRQPGRTRAQRHRAAGAGPDSRASARRCCTKAARQANRRPARQLRRCRREAELTPFIDDTASAFAGRPHRLPRRCQHRHRDCRRGRGGGVCAVSVGGGRPPDHQRPLFGASRRRLAAAAARYDSTRISSNATKYGANKR